MAQDTRQLRCTSCNAIVTNTNDLKDKKLDKKTHCPQCGSSALKMEGSRGSKQK